MGGEETLDGRDVEGEEDERYGHGEGDADYLLC